MSATVYITLTQLRNSNACYPMQVRFERMFGERVAVTKANVLKHLADSRYSWYGYCTWLKYSVLSKINQARMDSLMYKVRNNFRSMSYRQLQKERVLIFRKLYREQQLKTKKKK